jgi:mannose-6-phosphate isomerase
MLARLEIIVVEKPWGRTDIPKDFGDFGGRSIGEIWFAHPAGADAAIMVKFLLTSERLSIQVHPDDAAARTAGFPRGKEECWLVLDAESDAELGVGLKAETTHAALLNDASTLPPLRHALRTPHSPLHRLRMSRRRHALATLNVDLP